MRPPSLAQALVAAVAPGSDYEIVAGDLHEEYLRIVDSSGAKVANRWYWTQTLLSIPSLLSYSRTRASAIRCIGIAITALAVLIAMVVVLMAIDRVFGSSDVIPTPVWVCINYSNAIVFGAILAWLVRTDGVRVTFFASVFLVLCFVIPAVVGHPGSQAPMSSWMLLLGAVPVMCVGAAVSQIVRKRADRFN